jgi:hypothetical protein
VEPAVADPKRHEEFGDAGRAYRREEGRAIAQEFGPMFRARRQCHEQEPGQRREGDD